MFESHGSYSEEEADFLSELLVQQVSVVLVVPLVLGRCDALSDDLVQLVCRMRLTLCNCSWATAPKALACRLQCPTHQQRRFYDES